MKRILVFLLSAMLLFTACSTGQSAPSMNTAWPPANLPAPTTGTIENNVYTSTLLNLQFDGTNGWKVHTREELESTNSEFETTGFYFDMFAETTEEYSGYDNGIAHVTIYFVSYLPVPAGTTVPEAYSWYVDLMNTYNAEDPADVMGYNIAGTTYFYFEGDSVGNYTNYYFLNPADENYMLIIAVSLPKGMSLTEVTNRFTTVD